MSKTAYPAVSILIPCYNAEKWIHKCIKSALRQNYPNKEIIVVDDGSEDSSSEIIKSFGNKIKSERENHRGANAARNRLFRLSKGKWLQYLDADDYLLPGKVNTQIEHLLSSSDSDVVYSPVLLETKGRISTVKMASRSDFILNFITWDPIQTGGLLMKREALREIGLWRDGQPCCQEHELLLRFMKARKKFLYCSTAEAVYRSWNPMSVGRGNTSLIVFEMIKILNDTRLFLIAEKKWKSSYEKASARKKFECARLICGKDSAFAEKIMREIKEENNNFFPTGPAAPFLYRISYRFFGFSRTEKIALFTRKFR